MTSFNPLRCTFNLFFWFNFNLLLTYRRGLTIEPLIRLIQCQLFRFICYICISQLWWIFWSNFFYYDRIFDWREFVWNVTRSGYWWLWYYDFYFEFIFIFTCVFWLVFVDPFYIIIFITFIAVGVFCFYRVLVIKLHSHSEWIIIVF